MRANNKRKVENFICCKLSAILDLNIHLTILYRSYPKLKARTGSSEEIPLVQGKEQWLSFAGAAVKKYPMPKVRETQVRR